MTSKRGEVREKQVWGFHRAMDITASQRSHCESI